MSDFHYLSQFMCGYLYPDFAEEYGDEWGALAAYVLESQDGASELRRDIRNLTDQHDEHGISRIMTKEIRTPFDPTLIGRTWRDWLGRVSDEAGRLAAHPGAA